MDTTTSDDLCPTCRGAGYYYLDDVLTRCACKAAEDLARQMTHLDALSDMTHQMERMTFDAWDAARLPAVEEDLYDWAGDPQGWRVLHGRYGTGKTHLLAAIFHRTRAAGRSTVYCVVPDLLERLRQRVKTDEGYQPLVEELKQVELLLLDDYGAEPQSDWADGVIFRILDYRYRDERPTVIASNLALKDWPFRLASRMQDSALVQVHHLRAPDYRPLRTSTTAAAE